MTPLPREIVDRLNAEYALVMFDDGQVSVVWRNPETGEIRKRPTGIALRYLPEGYGHRLRARWLADPCRRELRLAAGTRFVPDDRWRIA